MKINLSPRLTTPDAALIKALRDIGYQVNLISEGNIAGTYNAQSAAPTTGIHAHGDFVKKLSPVEAGVALAKYVIVGWVCVAGGEPGTWVECRFLTGN